MKPTIRLLALDLDGTVLNDAKHITPETRRALSAAIAAGVTVIPASGRPLDGLCPEFLDIPGVEYALTSNGAALYRLPERCILHADYLDTAVAADLMARFMELEMMPTFFANGQGYATAQQLRLLDRLQVSEPVREYLRVSRTPLSDAPAFMRQTGHIEKFSLNFLHDAQDAWIDADKVRAILADYPQLSVVSGGTDNLEVTSPTANKGAALLALADHLGIAHDETMACGDSENDLAMLKAAGFSVAMGNAEACVLAVADAVTTTNEENGVAKAIYDYIL